MMMMAPIAPRGFFRENVQVVRPVRNSRALTPEVLKSGRASLARPISTRLRSGRLDYAYLIRGSTQLYIRSVRRLMTSTAMATNSTRLCSRV